MQCVCANIAVPFFCHLNFFNYHYDLTLTSSFLLQHSESNCVAYGMMLLCIAKCHCIISFIVCVLTFAYLFVCPSVSHFHHVSIP